MWDCCKYRFFHCCSGLWPAWWGHQEELPNLSLHEIERCFVLQWQAVNKHNMLKLAKQAWADFLYALSYVSCVILVCGLAGKERTWPSDVVHLLKSHHHQQKTQPFLSSQVKLQNSAGNNASCCANNIIGSFVTVSNGRVSHSGRGTGHVQGNVPTPNGDNRAAAGFPTKPKQNLYPKIKRIFLHTECEVTKLSSLGGLCLFQVQLNECRDVAARVTLVEDRLSHLHTQVDIIFSQQNHTCLNVCVSAESETVTQCFSVEIRKTLTLEGCFQNNSGPYVCINTKQVSQQNVFHRLLFFLFALEWPWSQSDLAGKETGSTDRQSWWHWNKQTNLIMVWWFWNKDSTTGTEGEW